MRWLVATLLNMWVGFNKGRTLSMTELASVTTLTLKSLDEGLRFCFADHRTDRLANAYSCCDQKQRKACPHDTSRNHEDFIVNLLQPEYSSETCLDSTAREVAPLRLRINATHY